jgi:hypothetical protein
MFIIIGIVILIIFGLIYYLAGLQTKLNSEAKIEKLAADILQSRSVSYYTSICLQNTLENGLKLIGLQGGYIYKDQPGSIVDFDVAFSDYNDKKAAVLIDSSERLPPSNPCYTADNAPAYCRFVYNITIFPELRSYSYGITRLPSLYKTATKYSIQSQIENYINIHVFECTNFSYLRGMPELRGYDIQEEQPKSNVNFEENSVTVDMDYPIQFSARGIPPITQLLKFNAEANVRFRKIYDAVNDIITKENYFLEYIIINDTLNGIFEDKELKFNLIKDNAELRIYKVSPDTDIIVLNDSASRINDENFIFQFARNNRNPVLDFISNEHNSNEIDAAVLEGKGIEIKPAARDPDEDIVHYSYNEWKAENYDEVWDDAARASVKLELPNAQNKWENSNLFLQTKKDSMIMTRHEDAGYHNLTVTASDLRLADFQIVRVLVELIFNVRSAGYNIYSDVHGNWVSMEDPYILNISQTTELIEPNSFYDLKLIDSSWNNELLFETKGKFGEIEKCIMLPFGISCSAIAPNILDMYSGNKLRTFPSMDLMFSGQVTGIINQSSSFDPQLIIKQCLPHKNSTNSVYPYNNENTDPFSAEHSCCTDDGKLKGISAACNSVTQFTCRPMPNTEYTPADIAVGEYNPEMPALPPKIKPAYSVDVTPSIRQDGDANDIYLRIFIQKCGKRGNICSGPVVDDYYLSISCPNKPAGEDETCSGPPILAGGLCDIGSISQTNPACVKYSGTTFERQLYPSDSRYNGACNEALKCSTNDIRAGYGANGPYLAKGTCNGFGECKMPYEMRCSKSCSAQCENDADCSSRAPAPINCTNNAGGVSNPIMRCNTANNCRCEVARWTPC